jgi:multicomponent Na+:H+ antiporter subunit E
MNYLALNLILSIIWTFLTGSFTVANFLFGLLVGYFVLWLGRPYLDTRFYLASVSGTFTFLGQYLRAIVLANIQLARDLLRPEMPFVSGIIEFKTEGLNRAEVAVLANMISLTPGTLSMDTDASGTIIYIHSVYAADPEELRRSTQEIADMVYRVKHPATSFERLPT